MRAADCSRPSSLRSPEASAAWLKEGPPRSGKDDGSRAMRASRVFRPFPHRHCKIAWPGKNWARLPCVLAFCSLLASHGRCCAQLTAQSCAQVLCRRVLACPSTWWLIVCPEKHGPGREKYMIVDFGGGDWYRRPLSNRAVAGEANALHNHLLCCLPNLHAAFWPGNPADKPTRSAGAPLY